MDPRLADDRPQFDRALDARLAGERRIHRLHAVDDVALRPMGDFERMGGHRRRWWSDINRRVADSAGDSAPRCTNSAGDADAVEIGGGANLRFVQVRDPWWNRCNRQQVLATEVRRMSRMLSGGWWRGGGRWRENRRVEPLQPGWSLNREQGDREHRRRGDWSHAFSSALNIFRDIVCPPERAR